MHSLWPTQFMSRIAVIGMGNWGTALAHSWSSDSHKVIGWTVEDEVYASIMENGVNEKYLPGVKLDIEVTMDLKLAIEESELIMEQIQYKSYWIDSVYDCSEGYEEIKGQFSASLF